MIDRLSAFLKKVVWLKPLFFIAAAVSFLVFGYVVVFEQGAENDVYLIPSVVVALWSLLCALLLSVFPHVPPRPDGELQFFKRLKIRAARGGFHIGAWIFCVLSAVLVWLSVRMLSVWRADF